MVTVSTEEEETESVAFSSTHPVPVVGAGTVAKTDVVDVVSVGLAECLVLFVPVILFFDQNYWLLSLACFMFIACAMAGVNNVITSIFPMMQKSKINAGTIAGIMDGFCYVGSAITAYGIGSLADKFSWHTVLYLFISVCVFTVFVCVIYLLIIKLISRKSVN